VAKALGYQYMDKELIVRVALEAGVPVSEVECFDEQPEHPIMRALRKFLAPPHPGVVSDMGGEVWGGPVAFPVLSKEEASELSILDEDAYVQMTQRIVLRLANDGSVVIMGRGSQAYLAGRSDSLHVRVVAPRDARIKTVMEEDEVTKTEAQKKIRRMDEQRVRYIKRHYGINWDSADHYHLVVNADQTGVGPASDVVVEAARQVLLHKGAESS
jgi:cytidylate kinase